MPASSGCCLAAAGMRRFLFVGSVCAVSHTQWAHSSAGAHMLRAAGTASVQEARSMPDVLGSLPKPHPAACKQLSF